MIKKFKLILWLIILNINALNLFAQKNLQTEYFKININARGYIDEMENISKTPHQNFAKPNHPSPVLCLYNSLKKEYYYPIKAKFSDGDLILKYVNGSMATINISPFRKYIRLTLKSLTNRKDIDDIQWGPYYTSINNLFGEIIGVARDTSERVNYSIGVLSLNNRTTGGPSNCESDNAPFQYIIHNPDKKNIMMSADLHEGQVFQIGGNGYSDVAFYSHPEEYYRMIYGNTAWIDSVGDIFITYHSANRNVKKTFLYSLMPNKENNHPNHLEREPIDLDYIGSSVALWGSPDSTALLDVIQNIVVSEHLPHPMVNGKWIKDPARYIPSLQATNQYDSTLMYARQMGFNGIQSLLILVDRSSEKIKDLSVTNGKIQCSTYTKQCDQYGINFVLGNNANRLPNGSYDVSMHPSKNLCYQFKDILAKSIDDSTTDIEAVHKSYFNEYSSWEGHNSYNVVKIGDEIISYNGITDSLPYLLKKVIRGYLGTTASTHITGDTIYKLQATCGYGYQGLIPNIYLQDSIAYWYATVCIKNGFRGMLLDGEEFLFNTGQGNYGIKRFFQKYCDSLQSAGINYSKIWGATLSEGAWHYSSTWDVGGGGNMYHLDNRVWNIEGKDLRSTCIGNYFPATFGGDIVITKTSTVQELENIEAISAGIGVTYAMQADPKNVEANPEKYNLFKAIKTWENARSANAYSRKLKKDLADPSKYFHLEQIDNNTWNLYKVNRVGGAKQLIQTLKRAPGY